MVPPQEEENGKGDSLPVEATRAEWRILLEDAWEGWLRPLLPIAAVVLLFLAYALGWFAEPTFARILAVVLALLLGVAPAVHGAFVTRRLWRGAAIVLGLGWATVYVWPVWQMVSPDDPLATVTEAGSSAITLPAGAASGATLLVRAPQLLAGGADGQSVRYRISAKAPDGAFEVISGELVRKKAHAARARTTSGGATVVQAVRLHTLTVPASEGLRLHVVEKRPQNATIELALLPGAVPWLWLALGFGLAFLASLAIDARGAAPRTSTLLPHAGAVAFAFVLLVRDALDPGFPVKPLFFTAFGAAVAGVAGATALAFVARRLLRRHEVPDQA